MFEMPDIWESGKTPLQRMYDKMMPGWDECASPPRMAYTVYAKADTTWRGKLILANQPFPCHLCEATDRWLPEGNGETITVFVCEHGVVDSLLPIRKISSVAARLVGKFEEAREI